MRRFTSLLMAAVAALTTVGSLQAAPATPPTLIVIALDGFRTDYLDRGLSPALSTFIATGVRAKAMHPVFPSVTEPNHYTLMTGLYPEHHGIVENTMVDPAMPGLNFGGPHTEGTDKDQRWWNQATPLWLTAQRHGLKTASSWWPGDDAVVHDMVPTYLDPRPAHHPLVVSMTKQVDAVLAWIDLPADQRPTLIRLHLDPVDLFGHLYGPDSTQVNKAISDEDAALARLFDGLKSRGLWDTTNIVIVSDHGMTAVSPARVIWLDGLIDLKHATVPAVYAAAGINPAPGYEVEIEAALLKTHAHMKCWRRADIPARFHYSHNARIPAIVCLADLGWTVGTHALLDSMTQLGGNHGYDNTEPHMQAIFLAHGPAFKVGVTTPAFDNVDVYPMLARLLAIPPEANDGSVKGLVPALRWRSVELLTR